MSYHPEYARLVQQALARMDRSPSWLARRLGVSPSTVTRWINHGARPRDPETVARVADVLGRSAERQAFLMAAGFGYQEGTGGDETDTAPADREPDSVTEPVDAADRGRSPPVRNLPEQITSFVGRAQESSDIIGRLQNPACRLLTLIGPGGVGKTRLAIAVAASQPLPVVYVPLQALSSTAFLPFEIADAAGVALAGREPLPDQLLSYLRNQRLLLVLDNFEHLLAAGDLLGEILRQAPAVKLLLTSRQTVGLPEEWIYPVPGLSVPPSADEADAAAYASVQLFDARARQVRTDFRLENDLEAVVAICRAVEGSPLAIELACSWLMVLSCTAIVAQLRQSFAILTTSLRHAPKRHQSMQAIFDQSWQMLDADERTAFTHLTVFRGGFTLPAAAEVAGATLPILSALVAKSLVRREENGRHQIHELLRQIGERKLDESPTGEHVVRHRHSDYFIRFLADRNLRLFGAHQYSTVQEIGRELENVLLAWWWVVDHLQTESICRAAGTLHTMYQLRSRYVEGADLFHKASLLLERQKMTADRGEALMYVLTYFGWLCLRLGRLSDADRALTRARALNLEFGLPTPPHLDGDPFEASMFLALARGNYDEAVALGERSLQAVERLEEPVAAAMVHYGMASAALGQDRISDAREHAAQGLALALSANNRWHSASLHGKLGQVHLADGDLRAARRHFEAAYVRFEELAESGGMAEHLANLAEIALQQRELTRALALFGHSHRLYRELSDRGGIARTHLGMGLGAEEGGETETARSHFQRALAVAVDAQITPLIVAVLTAVGRFLLPEDRAPALGLRALCLVHRHPSSDAQIRRQVLDALARSDLSAAALDSPSEPLVDLVATLQRALTTDAVNLDPDADHHVCPCR